MKRTLIAWLLHSLLLTTSCTSGVFGQSILHLKLNAPALLVRHLSVALEMPLGNRTSLSLGLAGMPKGRLPLRSIISSFYEATDSLADDFTRNAGISSWSVTPEFRYYLGRRPQTGFYLAPFLRAGGISLDYRYTYTADDGERKPLSFAGRAGTFGGGLLLGAQWNLGSRLLLDWWIVGASVGSAKVRLSADTDLSDLSAAERLDLEEAIESAVISGRNLDATIGDAGARAEGRLFVPGLRAGICLGLKL